MRKRWYVNVGVYYLDGIADVHLVIYADNAEDAKLAIGELHPGVRVYYVTDEEPGREDHALVAEAMNPNGW